MQAAGVGDKAAKAGGRQGRHKTVISAKGVKSIADALFEDGYRNDDVCRLSQLDLSHAARDLDRITVEAIPFMKAVTPYRFKIPIENTDDRGIKHVVHQMLLPHELMAAVYADNENMFHQIFGTRALEEFWSRQKSERLTKHPGFQRRRSKWIIPLRLFGDDAPVCNTNSVDTLLLCSCTAYNLPALLSKLPLCCTPIKHTDHSTFDAIHRVVMWSLEILASGVWPATNHEGGQWPETDRRYQLGRQQSRLMGRFTAIYWETTGDWKWLMQNFRLAWNYNRQEICYRCGATKDGANTFTNCHRQAPRRLTKRTHQEYLATFEDAAVVPPLAQSAGFELQEGTVMDWVHNNCLGVEQHASANVLMELCAAGTFGVLRGRRHPKLTIQLKVAWREFKVFCKGRGLSNSQQVFTPASLNVSGGDNHWPELKCKAHNGMMVMRWLAHRLETLNQTDRIRHMSGVCSALSTCDSMFSEGDMWLSDADILQVSRAKKNLFASWNWLAADAMRQRQARWKYIPKHHMLEHQLEDVEASGRNPASHWAFAEESMMGEARRAAGRSFVPGIGRRCLFALNARFGIAVENAAASGL